MMAVHSMETGLTKFGVGELRARRIWKPDPAPIHFPIVSADDHLLEPPDTFEGRLPKALQDRAPKVVENEKGEQFWLFEEKKVDILTGNCMVSFVPDDWSLGPVRYDQMRPSMYDSDERVKDMDYAGIAASLCFPSIVFGFAGKRLMDMKDRELGLASLRAYNDWMIEAWAGRHPDRLMPQQLAWLHDPVLAAEEIRRNAARGCHAVSFTENPEKLGLPTIYTTHWDPFFRACEETGTVVNLHVGSSSETIRPCSDSPIEAVSSMFPINGLIATVDWLFAKVPVRFPNIKITISEGGLGWLPMFLDRLEFIERDVFKLGGTWAGVKESPREILHRNFWMTSYYDPFGLSAREKIGVDRIMFEVDFPHPDSTWPHSQEFLRGLIKDIPTTEAERMLFGNACALYQHPVPTGGAVHPVGQRVSRG